MTIHFNILAATGALLAGPVLDATVLPAPGVGETRRTLARPTLPDASAEQYDAATCSWVPAPPAPTTTRLTRTEFRFRFTLAEQAAIKTAARDDVEVEVILDAMRETGEDARHIDTADPRTQLVVQALVAKGLVAAARVPEILAPKALTPGA